MESQKAYSVGGTWISRYLTKSLTIFCKINLQIRLTSMRPDRYQYWAGSIKTSLGELFFTPPIRRTRPPEPHCQLVTTVCCLHKRKHSSGNSIVRYRCCAEPLGIHSTECASRCGRCMATQNCVVRVIVIHLAVAVYKALVKSFVQRGGHLPVS